MKSVKDKLDGIERRIHEIGCDVPEMRESLITIKGCVIRCGVSSYGAFMFTTYPTLGYYDRRWSMDLVERVMNFTLVNVKNREINKKRSV